jgi:hypothetical protein
MKKHKWINLMSSSQKRCYVCNCIMTKSKIKGKTIVTYQNENSISTENIGCVIKENLIY